MRIRQLTAEPSAKTRVRYVQNPCTLFAQKFWDFQWARPVGRALLALLTEPPWRSRSRDVRLGHSVTIPRAVDCTPRRGQSVPRPASRGAMLTLLRLPR